MPRSQAIHLLLATGLTILAASLPAYAMTVPSVEIVAGEPEPIQKEQTNGTREHGHQDDKGQKDMTTEESGSNSPDGHRADLDTQDKDDPDK